MHLLEYPERSRWPLLIQRPATNHDAIETTVREILAAVKKDGDAAVNKFAAAFERPATIGNDPITIDLKQAITIAKQNIEAFHLEQMSDVKKMTRIPGITSWQETRPIEKVGFYIPGGSAPLFSTILMLAVPARIAGCQEIVLCCPSDHPAILYTAQLCGIDKIFKIGGAQAIAAMAYGTPSIPKVNKIFGPGNRYVTVAKQLVQLEGVAIDMPAGPSEVLIIADGSANAHFVAADLLSQAEHAPDAQVVLVTVSKQLALEVQESVIRQLQQLRRNTIATAALENGFTIVVKDLDEAVAFSNAYAPEHLILATAPDLTPGITNAGAVFIGNYAPVSAGDYASGSNHVLPTNGFAASYSGLTVDSFQKKISFQQITQQGLQHIAQAVMTMAEAEGLDAHRNSIQLRL